MNTVEKIEELTVFKTTDGELHESMDAACNHQEAIDFKKWLSDHVDQGDAIDVIAGVILLSWKVQPK